MMSKENVYLFYGFNGEYVLSPVCKEMVKRGYTCREINTAVENDLAGRLKEIKGKTVILVTDAHVFFDETNLHAIYPDYPKSISVLEVMNYLKPIKSFYYPHDLMDGFTHADKNYFSLFDAYLSPLPVNGHGRRFCPVTNVGWIKKHKIMTKRRNSGKSISINHGLGYFEYYRNDLSNMYNVFKPVWDFGVKVKLPSGQSQRSKYEDFFKTKNIGLYGEDAGIYDLIDESDIVITNALTAVSIEAALSGRKVINIYDGTQTEHSKSSHYSKLLGFSGLEIKTPSEAAAYLSDLIRSGDILESGQDTMKPFDMDKTIKIITGEINVR